MNISNPIRSVIPALHGDVLAVLARTEAPLTGRGIAGLIEGSSQAGVQKSVSALVEAGVVLMESHPPANLYRLNRRHLAAQAIVELATMRSRLLEAMRAELTTWSPAPWGAWLFGSAARGEGSTASDIDVLLVRPDRIDELDEGWVTQIDRLVDGVTAWTGNPCAVVEYSRSEFDELLDSGERLARDLHTDAVALTDRRLPRARRRAS